MLELKNINKSYEIRKEQIQKVLKDLNIHFGSHGFVSILGSSGNGKTTLLNIIGGLDHHDSGTIYYNQEEILDFDRFRKEKIGFVFQEYNLIPHLNAVDNVILSMSDEQENKRETAKRILKDMGMETCYKKTPRQMSGGQQQRVAIARMIAKDVDVIICDEPTGSLDEKTEKHIVELIKDLSKERLVLFVTHNRRLAETYSDRIIRIHNGKVTEDCQNDQNHSTGTAPAKRSYSQTSIWLSIHNLLGRYPHTIKYILLATFILLVSALAIIIQGEVFRQLMHDIRIDQGIRNTLFDLNETKITDYMLDNFEALDTVDHAVGITYTPIRMASSNYSFTRISSPTGIENITGNAYYEEILIAGRFPENSKEVLMSTHGAIRLFKELNIGGKRLLDQYETGKLDPAYVFRLIEYRTFILAEYGMPRIKVVGLIDDAKIHESRHIVYYIDGFTDLFKHRTSLAPKYLKIYKNNLYREANDVIIQHGESIPGVTVSESYYENISVLYNKISSFIRLSRLTLYVIFVLASLSFISLLFTSLFERKYEIGLYRSIGYDRKNIMKVLGLEMIIIGIISILLVIILLGALAALTLSRVESVQQFAHAISIQDIFSIVGILAGIVSAFVLLVVIFGNGIILRRTILSNINNL